MSLSVQMMTMAVMLTAGLGLGFCLDIYHVIQRQLRLKGWVVTCLDLFYWLASACLVFALLQWCNWGELRLYLLIVLSSGFFCYLFLLQSWMTRWIERLLHLLTLLLVGVLRLLERLFWNPLRFVLRLLWAPVALLLRWLQPIWQWKKER